MSLTRRQITQFSLMGLGALGTSPLAFAEAPSKNGALKILILGGTGFLGPHIVRSALERGHALTLFNRGRTDPHLFPDVEKLKGDRNNDLESLKGGKWDVVIDTSSSAPGPVSRSAALLKPNVGHYIYVSSTSVYRDWSKPNMKEDAAIYSLDGEDAKSLTPFERYGANKAICEAKVRDAFAEHCALIRPNAIDGPGLRRHMLLPYWVRRAAQGGEIMGPGAAGDALQYIDVRDLAEWLVHCAENSVSGTFNASSRPGEYTMQGLIEDCQSAAGTSGPIVWVENGFLAAQGFFAIPYWKNNRSKEAGFGYLNTDLAMKNGLKQRPKLDTTRYVHDWFKTLTPEEQAFKAGIPLEFERQVLEKWKAREAAS